MIEQIPFYQMEFESIWKKFRMALNGEGVTIKDRDWPVCLQINRIQNRAVITQPPWFNDHSDLKSDIDSL